MGQREARGCSPYSTAQTDSCAAMAFSNSRRVGWVTLRSCALPARRKLGFDYGKFDYVVHEGRAHLLDANRTPGALQDGKLNLVIGGKLARGVECYLGGVQPRPGNQ